MSEVATMQKSEAPLPQRIKDYFDGLRDEMRLVTWPSWTQVRATTAVVIGSVFAFAIYFAIVDEIVGYAIQQVFNRFSK
jgi:preprotein translocase subunit SecE